MKLENFKIDEIEKMAAEYNPRKKLNPGDSEYKKLYNSIKELGYSQALVINKKGKNKTLVSGHQRLSILKDLGYKNLDCIIVSLDKKKEKQLNIALNKITGNWDNDKLKDIMQELESFSKEDMFLTGFDEDEINKLFEELEENIDNDKFENDMDIIGKDEEMETNKGGHLHQSSKSSCIFNFHTFRFTYSDDIEIVKRIKKVAEYLNDEETKTEGFQELILEKMLEVLKIVEGEIED